MPRRKPEKPREQKIAEEFFPMEDNIKRSIEKIEKIVDPKSLETIEQVGKSVIDKILDKKKPKAKRKKSSGKKSAKVTKTQKDYEPEVLELKSGGYELIITEKPQAAMKIASALGSSEKRALYGVPYYEVNRDGKEIIVACAVGHLFALSQKQRGQETPVFDIAWMPNYMVRKNDFTKKYYDTLVSLAKKAGSITIATDYDIEGEVIGLNIVRFIAGQKDASRMKFSTLTEPELNEAYEHKLPNIDWGQAIAGETRHYLDWFYGINLSRALMSAIRSTGKFKVMSIGRVQGPALNLVVQKEKEILAFKPKQYWQIFITLENPEIELVHDKDIFNKSELGKFQNLKGKTGTAETTKTQEKLSPNVPFNLTGLQTEAYALYGINPSRTLQIAQSLYLAGLISYPRTSSQKLPAAIGYQEILEKLARAYRVEKLITRQTPIEGKKTDPAHPSIYPTGQGGSGEGLEGEERRLYDLIAKRFLSLFMDDAIIENKTVKVLIDGLTFVRKGSEIKNKGWLEIYPKKFQEKDLPDVKGNVKTKDSEIEEKETQPPHRFSPASIVSELEKRNLGTKATRANILETLYDRGYVQDQSIKATPLGISLIETLEKHSPIIVNEDLTRNFEKEMDAIQLLKKNQIDREKKVIDEAKTVIIKISEDFKAQENQIGKELMDAQGELWAQQKESNKLNVCPLCNKGNLQIMFSRKTKRSFIGCSNYPECKNIYSLPPGFVKPTEKSCDKCGFPMLMMLKKGRKPWFFCFNKDCITNKERLEAWRKKKEAEENAGQ